MTTPLILVPGLLCDAALWQPQSDVLADEATIIVADTLQDDSLPAMAARLLAAAPPRFALAGLSMGGYVAQEVMRQAPERVDRLALLDTNARADLEEQKNNRRASITQARSGGFASIPSALLPILIHPERAKDAAFCQPILTMMHRVGPEAFIRQQTAIMNRPDSRPDLAGYRCPVLCLVGAEDALTPPKVHAEITAALPHGLGTLVEIPHCGHLSTLEQPEAVTQALRAWLREA